MPQCELLSNDGAKTSAAAEKTLIILWTTGQTEAQTRCPSTIDHFLCGELTKGKVTLPTIKLGIGQQRAAKLETFTKLEHFFWENLIH